MKKIISLLLLLFSLSFYGQNDTISVVRHNELIFLNIVISTLGEIT